MQENDVLQEKAEYTALDLVNEVEKAVEEEWAALEEHYKKLRIQIRAGEASNSTQEAERAWLFYSRAQFLLGSPQEQRHLTVWSGGGIDPRLLAGLTVLSFFAGEILSNETIDKGEPMAQTGERQPEEAQALVSTFILPGGFFSTRQRWSRKSCKSKLMGCTIRVPILVTRI